MSLNCYPACWCVFVWHGHGNAHGVVAVVIVRHDQSSECADPYGTKGTKRVESFLKQTRDCDCSCPLTRILSRKKNKISVQIHKRFQIASIPTEPISRPKTCLCLPTKKSWYKFTNRFKLPASLLDRIRAHTARGHGKQRRLRQKRRPCDCVAVSSEKCHCSW